MNGVQRIAAERERQRGLFTPARDDEYTRNELSLAAIVYASTGTDNNPIVAGVWPWHWDTFKPGSRIRNLTKAGALIAAEIDRLQRLEP